MTYQTLKTSLTKAFTAVTLAGAMTGCATLCDKQCNLEQSARAMTSSSDVGIRAMGVGALEQLHPEIKEQGDQVRKLALPEDVECTVAAVEQVNGRKVVRFSGCATSTPAPAPAPVQ